MKARNTSSRWGWTTLIRASSGIENVSRTARTEATVPSLGTRTESLLVDDGPRPGNRGDSGAERDDVGEVGADVPAGDKRLEVRGGALGDKPAVVETGDHLEALAAG
jgi:hypothetical protein